MTIPELRKYRNAEPFHPFYLVLTDGQKILVREPENIGWSELSNRLGVYGPDDVGDSFGVERVSRIELARSNGKYGKRRRRKASR